MIALVGRSTQPGMSVRILERYERQSGVTSRRFPDIWIGGLPVGGHLLDAIRANGRHVPGRLINQNGATLIQANARFLAVHAADRKVPVYFADLRETCGQLVVSSQLVRLTDALCEAKAIRPARFYKCPTNPMYFDPKLVRPYEIQIV